MTAPLLCALDPANPRILVVGQNEALYRFICVCVNLHRTHSFHLLIATPLLATNADVINISAFAGKFGWNVCHTDCSEDFLVNLIDDFRPDLLVSVLYPKKISALILSQVKFAINFHPSLLPEHRGSLTQFWAVFDGDQESGVTCHHMVEALDQGSIVDSEKCYIDTTKETAFSLNRKLMTCFELLSERVMDIFLKTSEIPQGYKQSVPVTEYHWKKFPNEGYIDLSWNSGKIDRFIRAMYFPPYPGARLRCRDGREYQVVTMEEFKATIVQRRGSID